MNTTEMKTRQREGMMDKLIVKAERKAVSVLKKEVIMRRGGCMGLSDHRAGRYLKRFYLKEFWKIFYQMAAKKFEGEECDFVSEDSLFSALVDLLPATGKARNLRGWIEVRLSHNTFRLLESDGVFYIVASGMDAFPVAMRARTLVAIITAYDDYTGTTDPEALLNSILLEITAEEKMTEILTLTARSLIEDLLKNENVPFVVRQQKNGRLCCTIGPLCRWLPGKVFRTSFETFREDFVKAYKDFRRRDGNSCFL